MVCHPVLMDIQFLVNANSQNCMILLTALEETIQYGKHEKHLFFLMALKI